MVGDVAKDCRTLIMQKCKDKGWEVLELAIKPDHVHLFVRGWPTTAAHEIVKECKGITSHELRDKYPILRRLPSSLDSKLFCRNCGECLSRNYTTIHREPIVITFTIKLRLNKKQEATLNTWLWNLTGVWNWAIKKIEHNAQDKIYFSAFDFANLLADHGKKLEIPSHTIQGVLSQAHTAWSRCFKKIGGKPRLKGQRNKLNSISFPDRIQSTKRKSYQYSRHR